MMLPLPVTEESLIQHCEKYLFFYSSGRLTIHADDLNLLESGMLHAYVYSKILFERTKENKKWFSPGGFLPVFSYMMFKGMKEFKQPNLQNIELTANRQIERMLRFADYYDRGEPPDDKELGAAFIATAREGAETAAGFLKEFMERNNREGGENAEGKN